MTNYRSLCQVTLLAATCLAAVAPANAQNPTPDLTGMSLKDLLEVEVVSTASKFPQSTREAPASITVINAEEIRRFGYRTLADALRSVRGFYTTYDRNYTYVGMRGFARPGDYNTRVLLLIDGQRLNDGIYDMAPVGTDSPVPMALIDHIEIIRGPGSSLYGSNALFGVINVVTKTGGARKGLHTEAQGGSLGTHGATASYGRLFGAGGEMLIGVSGFRSAGQNRIHYPEFDRDGAPGVAVSLDDDEVSTLLGSVSSGRFSLRATAVQRRKQVPTASFDSVFGDGREATRDTRASVSAIYDGRLGLGWMGTARLAYDYYDYHGDYPTDYGAAGLVVLEDLAVSHAMTGEVTARRRVGRVNQVTFGAEVRRTFKAKQTASDQLSDYIDVDMPGTSVGIYAQDEIRPWPWLVLNVGARLDHFVDYGARAAPRATMVVLPRPQTAVKLLHGRAFRAPNAYERFYYNYAAGLSADLDPEQIRSTELVWEELLSKNLRTTISAFVYDVDRLVEQRESPYLNSLDGIYFVNGGGIRARGVEAEALAHFDNGTHVRVSHTVTRARDRELATAISNSPRHLSKASVQLPIFKQIAFAVEGQYVGERLTLRGDTLEGFFTSNLTATTPSDKRLTLTASVFNLFNRAYADPSAEEHLQSSIAQDGRVLLLRAGLRF
jgi:outer membrane receptor for ferrienterochelin and colicins